MLQWSRGRSPSEIVGNCQPITPESAASMEPRAITLGDQASRTASRSRGGGLQWSRGRSPSEICQLRVSRSVSSRASMEPRAITLGDGHLGEADRTRQLLASMEPRAITLGDGKAKCFPRDGLDVALQWSRGRSPSEIAEPERVRASVPRFNGAEGDHPRRCLALPPANRTLVDALQWSRGRSPSEMWKRLVVSVVHGSRFNGAEGDHPRRWGRHGSVLSDGEELQWSRGRSPSEIPTWPRARTCSPRCFNGAEGDHPRR